MKNQQRKNNQEVNLKRDFVKIRKMVYPYLLLAAFFLSLLLLVSFSAVAQPDTKDSKWSFAPGLTTFERVEMGSEDDVDSHLSRKVAIIEGETRRQLAPKKEAHMLVPSVISFVLASFGFVAAWLNEGSMRLSFLIGSILFLVLGVGLLSVLRAIKKLRKDVHGNAEVSERAGEQSEMAKIPSVPETPGVFLREQDMVFGPDGKGAFSVSFWFEEDLANNQEYLGMKELHYLFLEFEGDYKLIKRKEEINGEDYVVYTFQSGYQVDFNQSRYINFEEKEDKSYLLEIKIGKLSERIIRGKDCTLVIKVTLPAKINMANSMTYEDKTVEWRITGAHFKRDLTLKAFTLPFALS